METDEEINQLAALADRLTDPITPPPELSDIAKGPEAAAHGRALMLREYGTEEALENVLRRAGRKRVGEQALGASPTVRGRISEADYAAFKRLEERTGKNQSELLREAVQLLLAEHRHDVPSRP
ncbi:MAG: ribbon-helix-helix domain-containing protein [Pseudolysinimonas sp.]|uniref:ribbon-helix-helix domain-containing protein n=1 Tax=Pseudolysinimonas sp. TaxID=2680009 RepID=UPI003C71777C